MPSTLAKMAPEPSRKVPTTVQDFLVLPIQLPAQPSFPQEATHYLYMRANAPKVPTDSTPRELFLVNVPIDATELHIRSLFADRLGGARVESVAFEGIKKVKPTSEPTMSTLQSRKRKRENEEPSDVEALPTTWDRPVHRSGSTAVVTFVDKTSADQALRETRRAIKSHRLIPWSHTSVEQKLPPLGSARYLTHHRLRYPDPDVLQARVDVFMESFTAQETARAKLLARKRAEPDEDGFVLVSRGGRTGPAREEEAIAKAEELKKREKERVRDDFYRFQTREKNKEQARDLVRGFEEDQKRLEEMKRRKGKIRPER